MRLRGAARRLLRSARHLIGVERPIILMYHRVETLACDPWQLAVTPKRFAEQIALLRRTRDVVPLAWLAEKFREGRLPLRTAAVTFDDGYADVLHNALPILRKERCPATLFVTTAAISNPEVFWWDVLSRIILETPRLPDQLSLDIASVCYAFPIWNGPAQDATGSMDRQALHSWLHGLLRLTNPVIRREALHQLAEWAGTDAAVLTRDKALCPEELRSFAATDGMEVGAHTINHPSLPALEAEALYYEVFTSRFQCEEIIGRRVTGFAYPFGDVNPASIAAVRAAGLSYACSTDPQEVCSSSDLFAIPRILAADWDEAKFHQEVLIHG
jgi:peptidoglycan/xylan/chitin deacetylase (PgdA/CDA1 family)